MKTTDSLRKLIPGLAGLISAIAMTSCQTPSNPPVSTRVAMSTAAAKWIKVSSQPPTYYPRGVAADCPTDHWNGEWVYTGDEKGTRYFIPLRGMGDKRKTLIHDAFSKRSALKLDIIEAEDRAILVRNVRNQILYGPPTYALCLMAAAGAGG